MGQAAKLTGLCVESVRYYEQRGLIPLLYSGGQIYSKTVT
ncbi:MULTISPECIES: MerR family DNA-binding transcriptional regulator [unclassified Neptuniibacter]